MFVYYGTRHCGPVDAIAELGEVRTRFFHVWFVPLIPIGSMFITEDTDDGVRGSKVGLSLKSIFVAWSRTALFFSVIGLGVFCAATAMDAVDATGAVFRLLQKVDDPTKIPTPKLVSAVEGVGGLACGASSMGACVLSWWAIGRVFRNARGARKAELMGMLGVAPGLDDDPFD